MTTDSTAAAQPQTASEAEPTASEPRKKYRAIRFIRDCLVVVVAALLVSMILKTFLVRSFYIPSSSMESTLQINDRVMVNQLVPKIVGVKRGDIVVFKDPGGWLLGHPQPEPNLLQKTLEFIGLQPDSSNQYLIKRVIAKGGDKVKCCEGGKITVNGVPIDESAYLQLPDQFSPASGIEFEVTVPEGKLWVMGDNRYASQDSRYQQHSPGGGFVPESELVGRAFLLNWPLSRFGVLSNHQEVFKNVPDPER